MSEGVKGDDAKGGERLIVKGNSGKSLLSLNVTCDDLKSKDEGVR